MVLLTSSQISMALSSAVVILFTFALFIAGYVLQQQTLKDMQMAIKPRLPRSTVAETAPEAKDYSSVKVGDYSMVSTDTNEDAAFAPQGDAELRRWSPEVDEAQLWASQDADGTVLVREP